MRKDAHSLTTPHIQRIAAQVEEQLPQPAEPITYWHMQLDKAKFKTSDNTRLQISAQYDQLVVTQAPPFTRRRICHAL